MKNIKVRLGEVPVEASDTDETLRKKAEDYLPQALKLLGEKAGQEAWETIQRELRNSPLKLSSSSAERAKFIREAAAEVAKTATAADKQDIVESIFQQLQEHRDCKA